ncbi:kinesin-like protein [Lentinula aciculospora]|uniref:Kinesin-like protein n=1 Tax=Lentinula aciculospora TaxID=153920 RepID=A0A9W9A3M6_9AGAR|nr:kinesin-like protein [Lentinula aciculospora]
MVAAGSITVAVRVRPPTTWEAARLPDPCYDTSFRGDGALSTGTPNRSAANTAPLRDVVQIIDDRILTFDPDEKDKARAFVERGFMPPGTKRYKDRRFMFDKVFNHESNQQDVYASTAQPLLQGVLDGFNATVFAYGATGCGKTHTISGTDTDPGIIYLAMADLFQRIEDRKDDYIAEVVVTFLEIYNEEIHDLLAEPDASKPRGGLTIREDKVVKVAGLVELSPKSAEEVKEIVLQGNLRRTQSPTHANETSSRSHAVLQVHVTHSPRTASLSEQKTMGTLSIIDLAGSERAAATMNMGQRMVEGANINKSLLALGNCINALCESGGAIRHVPYRNSKLTRLLKFALGGNCKTVMIVCVAPTSNHFDDTHNTLIYAERATKIKTKVVTRNVVNVDRHVGRYVEAINRLNAEVAELKAKLAGKNNSENEVAKRKRLEASAEVERAKNDLKVKVEQTKVSIVDGAACSGKLSVAKAKLAAIRSRLAEISNLASSSSLPLSSDLEAERAFLEALAVPEEQALRADSVLNTRIHRSSNANAMFDATMRAVSERKSDKLDEVSVDNVKLDAACRKAEMDKLKAEEERNVLAHAVDDVAHVMVGLIGMLGRCNVMVGEASRLLQTSGDGVGVADASPNVSAMLSKLKEKNNDALKKLVGHSTENYKVDQQRTNFVDNLKSYDVSFTRRVSSGPAAMQTTKTGSRRSSTYRASSSLSSSSPGRHRTPRKSLRSSLAAQPYRRTSDKERWGLKSSKNVHWRDEAGQGDLDDSGLKTVSTIALTVIPASPLVDNQSSTSSTSSLKVSPQRSSSLGGGSESDWEDDKTDENVSVNLSMSLPASTRDSVSSTSIRSYGSLGKRPRPNRLDPSFLKSKTRIPTLDSLAEDDENALAKSPRRISQPLGDRSLNSLENEFNSNSKAYHNSPSKRVPATPRSAMKGRRRSNLGSRNEKARRRSSLIPQLSPPGGEANKPRRVLLASPGKRSKRLSISRNSGVSSFRLKPSLPSLSFADTSADMSMSRLKPTWR